MNKRPIHAAGTWYPADGETLLRVVENLLIDFRPEDEVTLDATAILLPHSSFAYSAECAARTLARIEVPNEILIIHTRHTDSDLGPTVAPFDAWQTPIGDVVASSALTAALVKFGLGELDEASHSEEHAAEVLLPFFQVLNKEAKVAALSVPQLDTDASLALGANLQALLEDYPEELLIVLASDLHHYGTRRDTERIDDLILERIEFLDASGVLSVAEREEVQFFGASHVAAGVFAAKEIGCDEVEIVHHTDSGEAEGQIDEVIGYASGFIR